MTDAASGGDRHLTEEMVRVSCPNCEGGVIEDIEAHWRSEECGPPTLTPQQRALGHAILLVSGEVHHTSTELAIGFTAEDARLIKWIASSFGVLTERTTLTGQDATWRSRAVPAFDDLTDSWGADGDLNPSESIPTTPALLRFVYALAGGIRKVNGTDRPVIDVDAVAASEDTVRQVFAPFHPLSFDRVGDGGVDVYLQATDEFFTYIGPPLPGFSGKWPGRTRVIETAPVRCPHCVNEYAYIEAHWQASGACSPPLLSWKQTELVDGILFGGGRLERAAHGHRLAVTASEAERLRGLDDAFGELSAGIHETPDGPTWYSRATPELGRFDRWVDGDVMRVPEDLHHTARMLRVAYALAGEYRDGKPQFASPHPYPSDAFIEGFFDDFDPMSLPNGVVLRDMSGFFQYVGWVPLPGCADKWPH